MTECQQAFEDFKAYLSFPLLLSPFEPGEELFSIALVRKENEVQKLVYFISRAL